MNIFETFMNGATVYDVTPDYLKKFIGNMNSEEIIELNDALF